MRDVVIFIKTKYFMDIKKSSRASLENKKLTYVLLGFVFVLSLIYVGFEWTQSDLQIEVAENTEAVDFEEEMTEQTFQDETPPPPPPPAEVPDVIEELTIVDDETEVADVNFSSEDDENMVQEVIQAPIAPRIEEEEVEEIFIIVEKQPEFPGGMAALMKYFSENVRYPTVATENNIQGRVVCQFTVWKDGSISDVKVVRGVDPALDREAVRLVSNMPKWKPGEQRGKAVSCKYPVPVVFKLQ
jgi:protein TonB